MKIKPTSKYTVLLAGLTLTAIMTASLPLFKVKPDCVASQEQTVVRWKDEYWPCRRWWSIRCMWPFHRKHSTYKVTINGGTPVLDAKGNAIPIAGGMIRKWSVYNSKAWNAIGNNPARKKLYSGHETIADNEYVVVVETRYRLFHNVEATLRICTQKINATTQTSST